MVEIQQHSNGFTVKYSDSLSSSKPAIYIYRSVDDLELLKDLARVFFSRDIEITVR